MTLTDCMKASADGNGYDCQHCGLHVDQCVQEDDIYLQDERYKLQAELVKTKTGRALSTTAHRTLHFSDTARRLHSAERPLPTTTAASMDVDIFADAPLSSARQPELKTFTFKEETLHSADPAEHVVVYEIRHRTSPRFSLRTIARPVAISSSSSEQPSEEESASDSGEQREVSVDWPDILLEGGEISVDGPPLDYTMPAPMPMLGRRQTSQPPTESAFYREDLLPKSASVIYTPQVSAEPVVSDSDDFESSTSADTLSSESGEYSVAGPDPETDETGFRSNLAASRRYDRSVADLSGKSMTDINLYRLFYPHRVPQLQEASAASGTAIIDEHSPVTGMIDSPFSPSPVEDTTTNTMPDIVVQTVVDQSRISPSTTTGPWLEEKVDTCTTTTHTVTETETTFTQISHDPPTGRLRPMSESPTTTQAKGPLQPVQLRQPEDDEATLSKPASFLLPRAHLTTPLEVRRQEVRAVLRGALQLPERQVAITSTPADQQDTSDDGGGRRRASAAKGTALAVSNTSLTIPVRHPVVRVASPVEQQQQQSTSDSVNEHRYYVKNVRPAAGGVRDLPVSAPLTSADILTENLPKRRKEDRVQGRRKEPVKKQPAAAAAPQAASQTTSQTMTSALRYSLPPLPPTPATQIPITGSSFKTDYPTTAQLLAQQQRERYDYLRYDETGSPNSTATLPYTVDGTKVIYPPAHGGGGTGAAKKHNAHSYASSRVSTTSDQLDGYPPSPSPSIPDSTFSLASRGSNGRLSRRTHATIYLKGTDGNSKLNSRSTVDLTVESQHNVPATELQRQPAAAQQLVVGAPRRSSSSSSSSGRGIQKLTIKMTLKEKKHDSSNHLQQPAVHHPGGGTYTVQTDTIATTPAITQQQHIQHVVDIPHSITGIGEGRADDLPNGATAASTASYRKQLLPLQLAEGEPVRRAVSAHHTTSRYASTGRREYRDQVGSKARLSSSEVELCKPEIVTFIPASTTATATATSAAAGNMTETHIPIYERRPATRDSMISRAYSQASSSAFSRDPSKPKPYRSYERLDIIGDDGGRVMREVVEEMRGDHISIQVHEKGDGLSEDRVAQIKNDERTDLQRLEQSRPNLEIAMTSDTDGLVLPEKPPSPARSRREKYELYQAMAWQRDITDEEPTRSRTPVSFHEVEYAVRESTQYDPVVREETRVAESRSVSAPAPVRAPSVPTEARSWYPERQPALPVHTSHLSSTTYSNTEHQSHISYRSIFDKCYTDERISELRKSANDLRTLASGGQIRPWSTQRDSSLSTANNKAPTTNFKCDYPPAAASTSQQPSSTMTLPARPLPPYREPLSGDSPRSAGTYDTYRPPTTSSSSTYAPALPVRGSSTRTTTTTTTQDPKFDPQYSQMKSYTHESHSTTTSSSTYRATERDPAFRHITQYKSTPTLLPTTLPQPQTTTARTYDPPQTRITREPLKSSSPYQSGDTAPPRMGTGYVPYVSTTVGITSLPRTTDSYGQDKVTDYHPHLRTVEALIRRTTGQPPLPRDFMPAPITKDTSTYKPSPKPSTRYESNTTSTSSTFEKPRVVGEPRSTGSSWAYGHKLPDEQYRSTSTEPHHRDPPLKTVEPAVIEALRTKPHNPPTSPDVRPKDWVPPCKAKILQAKRKYMNQPPLVPAAPAGQPDPWDRYKSASRERVQLRISRESLDAINKEATRGARTRMSAPDLTSGSMRALVHPAVYRSKIHWPEREVQAKLSESQEYLARRYQADQMQRDREDGDPARNASFANRWDARSRSLPPMSRYTKSAATTPSETPYPEYMDENKAKSMEFLADVKKFSYQIVPENQLQRENISGYAASRSRPAAPDSEYGDQVRKSLQKLDLPEWYVNSPYSQPGFMEGTVLRHRAHSTTDSNYSPYATLDRSEMTSPTGTMQSSDAQVISRRVMPQQTQSNRGSRPQLSASREDKVWDMYSGPYYNKKPARPAAIYSPASETHRQQQYNPHDSGWSSDWNSHHESSQDSDESTHGESRRSPRAWTSNAPKRAAPVAAPLTTSSSSAWYVPPLQRRPQNEPPGRITRSYSEQRPPAPMADINSQYRQVAPPYVPPAGTRPSTYFDPSLSERRVIQSTPWEVTSIKTETIKTEKLAKKNFVTETNDPVKINQFSHSNAQWGSYV